MKKVLLVSCEGLGNGGVQAVMMSIVRNLYRNYRFDALLFTSERRFYDDEFLSFGGKILRIPRYEGENKYRKKIDYYIRGRRLYKEVKRVLQDNGPYDVIHCNDEFENAILLKVAADLKIPVRISHTHIISKKSNFVTDWLENYRRKLIEKYATLKIGCSQEANDAFYCSSKNTIVVNNAFDNSRFNKEKYEQIDADSLNLVQIGSYSSVKNQVFSLKVLNEILKRYPNAKLHLVGFPIGNYVDEIKKTINQLNLSDSVEFYPSDYDTPRLLSESTALLLPSLHEGFGIVLIEAQAMGKKCYASDAVPKATNCGGVCFLSVKDGETLWSDKIISDFESGKCACAEYDVSAYAQTKIMQDYINMYEGNKIL